MNEIPMLHFSKHYLHEIKMKEKLNMDAVVGLAIATAILRLNFDNQTTINEFIEHDIWDEVAELAFDYIKWIGIDTKKIEIDKYVIAQSFWGLDENELDDATSAYCEDEYFDHA